MSSRVGMNPRVRVVTFNMLHGRSMVDGRVDVRRFAEAVRDLDPDVLALQEVDRDQQRSDLAGFVAAISGAPGATWVAATGREQPGTATYGIALLSRYPVRSWQVTRLPRIPFRFPMWLPTPRKVAMVFEEPRVAVAGIVETPLGDVAVANTHLSYVPFWNGVQLRRLRRDLAVLPDPLLLVGDLNMAGGRPARITGYRPLAAGPTFPADVPRHQLDHILLRGRLAAARDAGTCELPLSDHRALIVDL